LLGGFPHVATRHDEHSVTLSNPNTQMTAREEKKDGKQEKKTMHGPDENKKVGWDDIAPKAKHFRPTQLAF
jgi:hypothetical protein